MDRVMRILPLLLMAGLGFLAGSLVHPGVAAPGLGKAPPCAQAAPTARPSPSKVGVASYKGWTVTVTRFALHKPGDLEPPPPGDALYLLHVIVNNQGTLTWLLFSNQFKLEDEHHFVYGAEPLTIFPDVHLLGAETLTPGTKIEGDVLKFAPAHGHFHLRVNLAQIEGLPDLVITLPPLQPT